MGNKLKLLYDVKSGFPVTVPEFWIKHIVMDAFDDY